MAFYRPQLAPRSQLAAERRGRVVGRFCHGCGSVYSLHAARHHGKPVKGKDHIASTCTHEGEAFVAGAGWWEPAVEVLPAPAPEVEAAS